MSVPAAVKYLDATSNISLSTTGMPAEEQPQTVMVVGATGKQGAATVAQLCELPDSKRRLHIIAVTRDPQGDAPLALRRKHPQIKLHAGNLDDLGPLFDSLPSAPDALFSVQPTLHKGYTPAKEVVQGQKLHEAAIDIGVKHIVYSSVDRHGDDSDTIASKVPHFDSKMEIEQHLTAECARAGSRTTWTILRPTTFFDNLTPDLAGQVVAATMGKCTRPHQMVACRDIGWFAARALTGYRGGGEGGGGEGGKGEGRGWPLLRAAVIPTDANPWVFRKISLAGDELTLPQMRERFYEKMGYPLPEAYGWLGSGALWYMADYLGAMYAWLGRVGYGADVAACRREHPGMLTFGAWVERGSAYTASAAVRGSWLH